MTKFTISDLIIIIASIRKEINKETATRCRTTGQFRHVDTVKVADLRRDLAYAQRLFREARAARRTLERRAYQRERNERVLTYRPFTRTALMRGLTKI